VTAPGGAPTLSLAVAQTAPVLRDVAGNASRLRDLAGSAGADLLVSPELSLTGYDVGDAVHHLAATLPDTASLLDGAPGLVIAGAIERAHGGPFNTAVAARNGRPVFAHRKLYLPTYGMFDEGRFFGRGSTLETFEPAPGWSAGILVCEDFWHPGLAYVLASRGIDLLVVQAAAPGRGVWAGGATGAFASADVWERMARTTAQLYGIYVAFANRVGVEGGVTFAGGSLIAGPDGAVIDQAPDHAPALLRATCTREAIDAARRPYAHARDDDPRLVVRELQRGLA
jgi:predicted amidohydrolase